MSDVFVSYSHLDRTFVRRLHTALTGREKEVWVDDHGIPPASKWDDYLKEAVETADSFVFVISPDSASSVECRKELDYAASLGKRIIPLNLRASPFDQLPPVLMDRQFVPGRGCSKKILRRRWICWLPRSRLTSSGCRSTRAGAQRRSSGMSTSVVGACW